MNMDKPCAWVTLLTQPGYLPGVLALARSLKKQESIAPLVVMVTPNIEPDLHHQLTQAGCLIHPVNAIGPDPSLVQNYANARFAEVWAKLAVWQLEEYRQLVFLDADMLIIRNMDELLTMELPDNGRGIAACHACRCNPRQLAEYPADWRPQNCYYSYCDSPEMVASPAPPFENYLNGGLLVLQPGRDVYQDMMVQIAKVRDLSAYVFAEQDFLNHYFRGRWQPLHYGYNALKTLAHQHPKMWDLTRVKNLHFILDKPWEQRPQPSHPCYPLHQLWWQVIE